MDRKRLIALVAPLLIASSALAQGSGASTPSSSPNEPGSSDPSPSPEPAPMPWPDLHNQNRAIAFGSVLMAANGGHVADWQEVQAWGGCPDSGSTGGVATGTTTGDNGNTGSTTTTTGADPTPPTPVPVPPSCTWSVLYTTHYELFVCPNGRAFILRSGEGVDVQTRDQGDYFAWSEGVGCDDGSAVTPGAPVQSRGPIDVKRLTRRAFR